MTTPVLERFTQTDPKPYGAGSAFENSYVYGRNNPTRFVDPNGKRAAAVSATNSVVFGDVPAQQCRLKAKGESCTTWGDPSNTGSKRVPPKKSTSTQGRPKWGAPSFKIVENGKTFRFDLLEYGQRGPVSVYGVRYTFDIGVVTWLWFRAAVLPIRIDVETNNCCVFGRPPTYNGSGTGDRFDFSAPTTVADFWLMPSQSDVSQSVAIDIRNFVDGPDHIDDSRGITGPPSYYLGAATYERTVQ